MARMGRIPGWLGRITLAGIMFAWAGAAWAQALTSPTLVQRSWPEAEAVLQRVAGAWEASQSIRYKCELDYILKGTNTEKRDQFRVDLRARLPRHIAVKVYTNGSVLAIVYDGEFVFTHSKGNRFSKAPLTGDLKALLASGRLAAYPMVLVELFAADSPAAYLNQFDGARVEKGAKEGETLVVLTRRRETITIALAPHDSWLMPTNVEHEWTFDPEVLENTDKNLQLHAFERYTIVDASQPVPIEELHVQNIAMELMKELGLTAQDAPTTASQPAATPSAEATSKREPDAVSAQPGQPTPAPEEAIQAPSTPPTEP